MSQSDPTCFYEYPILETEETEMAKIESDDGHYIFRHEVGGYIYSFNVNYVPEDKRQWFCDVVGRLLDEIDARTRRDTEQKIKRKIQDALGL